MYDLIIIGAGPAGFGASIYAARYKLKHLVIGSDIGGQIVKTSRIENWAGFESISGPELMNKIKNQAEKLGAEIVQDEVGKITKEKDCFSVETKTGRKYQAKAIILALGMRPRKLNVPGEDEFVGKGVSYCAICDAMFFKQKDVAVVGGGDSAAKAALHLAEFSNKVRIFYLDGKLIMEPALQEKIKRKGNVEMHECQEIIEIKGESKVSGIVCKLKNETKEIPVSGIFIEIGSMPSVEIAKNLGVATDEEGYIIVEKDQSTNIAGVYAAGDVTTGSNKFRQLITSVAEGSIAASSVYGKLKTS
ncbi:MAG: FAD-dependent oxidoreductase [Patescibacteria group bacterium]